MPPKGKKRQLHAIRNHQDNPNAVKNHQDNPNAVKNRQDNLNAVKNRQDNPNAVRKQLTGLLWYYRQNCLICHLAKLPHLNRRPQYHLAKLPHLNRGPTLNLAKLPHLNRGPHFSHHYLAKHPQHYFRHKRR
jgi:hypothetical protein